MKILVVASNFYPDIFEINNIVIKLVDRGHEVTVLTGLPDCTTLHIPKEYKYGKNRIQNYHKVNIVRVPTIARRKGPIWRSLAYISFWFNASIKAKLAKWDKFDIVYVWEVSPVTQIFPASVFAKRFDIPLYVYCMDIWPECVKAMGINGGLPYRIIHSLSKKAYKSADHIAISSKPFREYLCNVCDVNNDKISYCAQYGQQSLAENDYSKESSDTIYFLYIGNLAHTSRVPDIIRAFDKIREYDFEFTIAGGGNEVDKCKSLICELKLENKIHFIGAVPFNETGNLYKKADCCVLALDGSTHIGDTLPGKLQTYMAVGKPIIASCNGAGYEVINEAECGIAVPANNIDLLAEALREFITNREKYSDCGKKAKDYFNEHFTEMQFMDTLESELQNLIKKYRGAEK